MGITSFTGSRTPRRTHYTARPLMTRPHLFTVSPATIPATRHRGKGPLHGPVLEKWSADQDQIGIHSKLIANNNINELQ